MKESSTLYFIAIIPPESVKNELTSFKEDFAKRFQSKKALNIVPHITLKIPFRVDNKEHDTLLKWFVDLDLNVRPFNIRLDGFGSFMRRGQPIVFVRPVATDDLTALQKNLIIKMESDFPDYVDKDDHSFTPHMTIAYRDLDRSVYKQAWKEYKSKKYEAEFHVNRIALLMHNSKVWNVMSEQHLA